MDRRSFLTGLALLSAAGCSSRTNEQLTVGSKNFTEQLILGELLTQYLGGVCRQPIERRFYLAGTYICHQALLAGRIDIYVEYTGTALAAILKEQPSGDSQSVYRQVKEAYKRKFNLYVMPPLGFNNSFAMVMRGDDARRLKVATLSQLASVAHEFAPGVGYEFLERQDGYKGSGEYLRAEVCGSATGDGLGTTLSGAAEQIRRYRGRQQHGRFNRSARVCRARR